MANAVRIRVVSRDLPSPVNARGHGALEKTRPCVRIRNFREVAVGRAQEAYKVYVWEGSAKEESDQRTFLIGGTPEGGDPSTLRSLACDCECFFDARIVPASRRTHAVGIVRPPGIG